METEQAVLINLADYEEFGGGYMATSYNHRDGKTMLKLYRAGVAEALPARELQMARAVAAMGLPTPAAVRLVTDGSRFGAEFRRLHGKKSFARAISDDPSSLEDYATAFARMCRRLHATPCDKGVFPSAADSFRRIVAECPHYAADEKARIAAFIDAVPQADTCLHGDLHIGNVLRAEGRDYWIDLGDFAWGNPLFDVGMTYLACNCNDEELSQYLYHVGYAQMQCVWRVFLNEYFGVQPGTAAAAEVEARVRPFAALKMLHFGTVDEMRPEMDAMIRQELLS